MNYPTLIEQRIPVARVQVRTSGGSREWNDCYISMVDLDTQVCVWEGHDSQEVLAQLPVLEVLIDWD